MAEQVLCPYCGEELPEIAERLSLLQKLVELLQKNRELLLMRSERGQHSLLVASDRRNTFHRPECMWMEYVNSSDLIEFSSHEEAVEAGYRPCKTCRA